MQASYLTILLVASKFNLIAKGMWDPSGVIKSIPIPFPYWFVALSNYIFHVPNSTLKMSLSKNSSLPSSLFIGFLAQKADMTLPLIALLATYFKSNSASKVNHLDNLPLKVRFSKRYFNGSILATTHIWKGTMICLNFCTAQTSAKHDFSVGVYLVL